MESQQSEQDLSGRQEIGLAALLVVDHLRLAELLQLPAGSHIDAVWSPVDQPGVVLLRLRGAGWPVKTGALLPRSTGILTRHISADGAVERVFINWQLPSQASAGCLNNELAETPKG